MLSADINTLKNKLPKGDALGVGVVGMYDANVLGAAINKMAGMSLAYHKSLGKDSSRHLSFGVQGMMVNNQIKFDQYYFGAPPIFVNRDYSYLDFSAGVMYSGSIGKGASFYLGYSCYHLNSPIELSAYNDDIIKIPRHSVYAGSSHRLSNRIVLHTSGLYLYQQPARDIALGSSAAVVLNAKQTPGHDKTTLHIGGWYRYEDAVIPYMAIEQGRVRLGLSYDINIASFTPATRSVGAYELSLSVSGFSNKRARNAHNSMYTPKFY